MRAIKRRRSDMSNAKNIKHNIKAHSHSLCPIPETMRRHMVFYVGILCFLFIVESRASFPQKLSTEHSKSTPTSQSSTSLSGDIFVDRSASLNLGDHVGSVIAVGDFTSDRYNDLLVVEDARKMRDISVRVWNHHTSTFQTAPAGFWNSTFMPLFSIDYIRNTTNETTIASASTLDANLDGYLDVILSLKESEHSYMGVLLLGDGFGRLSIDKTFPGLAPNMLTLDANEDMLTDIFYTSTYGERVFLINRPGGQFARVAWTPGLTFRDCIPANLKPSAFVDINGDCHPDLVITSSCGMEVWFNTQSEVLISSRWVNGRHYVKRHRHDFTNGSYVDDSERLLILNASVWSPGDSRATFADFNGDGSIDIAVPNSFEREVRISYNMRRPRHRKKLCAVDPGWHFRTQITLRDVNIANTALGRMTIGGIVRVGDFNFDGKADILLVDGDSGTLSLYRARASRFASQSRWIVSQFADSLMFPFTGGNAMSSVVPLETLRYERLSGNSVLGELEDPLAATFFDLGESGGQDILVSQQHGTRLLGNNYQNLEDSVYFKATGFNSISAHWKSGKDGGHAFSPLPGNTFKVSYGGRHGKETIACTQCPHAGALTLQSCSCLFGITRIANYIEELAMGGAGGVRTWNGLMPNALAVIWPQRHELRDVVTWKVSYLSKGRDGQMKRIALVLCTTLVILFFAIVYMHNLEKREIAASKLDVGYA